MAGRLGHRNPSTTLDVYSHFLPVADRDAADALGQLFDEALATTGTKLTASVTDPSGQGTPTGTVNFLDNGASLGTGTLSGGTATLTTSTMPAGTNQQLTAVYSGDSTYGGSTSPATAYTITPLPTVSANLPTSVSAPSASEVPTVTGLSPAAGPTAGGTQVTITGTGFTPGATVDFGSTSATNVTVTNSTSITATSPKGTGAVNVTVTTAAGTSPVPTTSFDAVYTDGYAPFGDVFVYGAPTVTSVSANSGPSQNEVEVLITGTGFTSSATVDFGSTAATNVTVVSSTEITATSPAGTAGNANVTVTTPAGTSPTSAADQFFYGVPTVTAVSPNAGPTTGGTTVTVNGTGFTGASAVKFGTVAATGVTVVSPNQLTATSPTGSGVDHVTVTTNGGTSSTSGTANEFTYNSAPSVNSLTPDTGPAAGGTNVTVTGANFTGANAVTFGATPASSYNVVSSTSITATAPRGTGAVDVTVSSANGTSATGLGDAFAYGAPSVTAVTPNAGTTSGGDSVVITGTGFVSGSTVDFGTTPATSATVTSPTSITAVSPAESAGTVAVTVTNPAGTSAASAPQDSFTYSAGGAPGQGSLTVTNPSAGQSWDNLYLQVVLSLAGGTNGAASELPANDVTVSYQDTSGDWCPLTLTASGSGTAAKPWLLTGYFSGAGSSCSAPSSFSLASGATLSVPIQVTYATDTYLGVQGVTATMYSGTCASATSCTQSGDMNGSVVGSGSYQIVPPGTLATTITDPLLTTGEVRQGFQGTAQATVKGTAPPTTTTYPTGTVEYLLDGTPVALTTDGTTPAANPATISKGAAPANYFSTADLSPGTHTLTIAYSGDGVFGPSTVTGSFTVLAPPTGSTAYTCTTTFDANENSGTYLAYVTASSTAPSPTLSGTSAWVSGVQVALDADPLLATENFPTVFSDAPTTFALTPGGSVVGTATVTTNTANGGTVDNISTWSAMAGSVPVSGDPGSSVQVALGVEISSCASQPLSTDSPPTATCQVTLPAGQTHSVVATYSGDGNFIGSTSDPLSQVTLPGTTTSVISTKDPSPPGNVTFWAGVSPSGTGATPTGTVAFSVDGKTLAACSAQPLGSGAGASCTVSFKAGTSHKVYAVYAGSSTYSGSKSSTIVQTVTGSSSSTKPKTTTASATLASGKTLTSGQSLTAGSYRLTMQSDGNLVEYKATKALWSSRTSGHPGAGVVMQKNGNLVLYSQGKAIWSTKTAGHAGAHLTLQAKDGNVVISTPANKAIWSTGT